MHASKSMRSVKERSSSVNNSTRHQNSTPPPPHHSHTLPTFSSQTFSLYDEGTYIDPSTYSPNNGINMSAYIGEKILVLLARC